MSTLRSIVSIGAFAVVLLACSDVPLTAPDSAQGGGSLAKAGRLRVTPPRLTFTAIGETATLTASTGAPSELLATVSDPACVNVSPRRLRRSPGKFTVAATSAGTCTVTVTDGIGASAVIPVQVVTLQRGTVVNGLLHTCGLTSAGAAYCWGRNESGQLGNATNSGTSTPNASPLPVQGGLAFARLTAGAQHTCGLTAAGAAYCWGSNALGQLGTTTNSGTFVLTVSPVQVGTTASFVALEAGSTHTCGLTGDGTVSCWGYNYWGQLGNDMNAGGVTPTPVPLQVTSSVSFTGIAAGENHTCALTAAGAAWCWGRNNFGQLGTTLNLNTGNATPAPQLVAGGLAFTSLAAGGTHTCGLTVSAAGYCWGNNERGQLGTTTGYAAADPVTAPVPVEGSLAFTALAAGNQHTCGIVASGAAYCWGVNMWGQLGSVTDFMSPSPTPRAVGGGLGYLGIAAGKEHTCAVTVAGAGYCWGSNQYGQLGSAINSGTGEPTTASQPVSGGLAFAIP